MLNKEERILLEDAVETIFTGQILDIEAFATKAHELLEKDKKEREKELTIYEKLIEEFGCAITATFGGVENEEYDPNKIDVGDINEIARKVKWYLDLL